MKLWCFANLIATMVIATSAFGASEIYNKNGNILNVYGNISGGQYFSKSSNNSSSNYSFVRYGLFGETYLNGDKISGFGRWEHEFPLKNVEEGMYLADNGHALLGYLGVKLGNFGSFDYGRNYGILHDVKSWTDFSSEFGGDTSLSDNFLSGRASNVITYRNSNFFGLLNGLNFAVQYQGENNTNKATGRTVKTSNGEGYGISASYHLNNGMAASVVYANSNRTFDQRSLDSDCSNEDPAEAYYVGVKYDAYGAYIAAVYGETYNMTPFGNFDEVLNPESMYGFANKTRNVSVIAQYRFNCGLTPSISYLHSKASDLDNGYGNYLKKYVTLGSSYLFNKKISATMDYRLNLLVKNDFTTAAKICTDDMFAVGLSYLF
ncbi:outer membrane protein [Candidatus Blochmanniella vafra str. BVAF]|uniref:Outer membrane protein n=1 Tax=Blochmanniella vafra (strain BVAF) TaxID=859654 RepID=E8Q738_BLOVB|nr:porin OmpC [Candidatus Blochmannia vafer]ADV33862.1 outer membrane protein [Candidatus Blochmannia vafer str. BVAF]